MATTIATLLFVLFMTTVVPVLVIVLIWRTIRRTLKNAGLPGGTLDIQKLRELVEQARAQQAQPSAGATLSVGAASAGQGEAILVKSMGYGPSIIAYLFTGIGAIAAVVAITFGMLQLQFLSDVVRAEGQVVRNVSKGHKSGYYPEVRFLPDGSDDPVEFRAPIGNRPAQFDVGETVGVLYPPGRPQDAKIDNWVQLWFAPMLCGFFTLVFGGIGVGFLVPVLRQRLRARWARDHGLQVYARFSGVQRDTSTRVNGRNPFRVFADWRNPADGKLYRFQSQKVLWSDPSGWLQRHPDIPLRVDPQEPRRYWLDVKGSSP